MLRWFTAVLLLCLLGVVLLLYCFIVCLGLKLCVAWVVLVDLWLFWGVTCRWLIVVGACGGFDGLVFGWIWLACFVLFVVRLFSGCLSFAVIVSGFRLLLADYVVLFYLCRDVLCFCIGLMLVGFVV